MIRVDTGCGGARRARSVSCECALCGCARRLRAMVDDMARAAACGDAGAARQQLDAIAHEALAALEQMTPAVLVVWAALSA